MAQGRDLLLKVFQTASAWREVGGRETAEPLQSYCPNISPKNMPFWVTAKGRVSRRGQTHASSSAPSGPHQARTHTKASASTQTPVFQKLLFQSGCCYKPISWQWWPFSWAPFLNEVLSPPSYIMDINNASANPAPNLHGFGVFPSFVSKAQMVLLQSCNF